MCIRHDQITEGLQEYKIPLSDWYIGIDSLSQVVGPMSPPSQFKPRLRKYYASINLQFYRLAQVTNQVKENIIFQLNQEETFNPADKLGKFDIDKDPVDKWTSLALEVLHPEWFQRHPKHYLHKMIKQSSEKSKRSIRWTHRETNK